MHAALVARAAARDRACLDRAARRAADWRRIAGGGRQQPALRGWVAHPAPTIQNVQRAPGRNSVVAHRDRRCRGGRSSRPGGDEPHYLVITQSLLKDGDLQIENNYAARDYAAYFGGDIRPDYLVRGRDGQIYSIHAPGVSAVVLPTFALLGFRGAQATMVLLLRPRGCVGCGERPGA